MSISVIVSNFNGDRFLPRLLETLEAQHGVTMEIIVVDRNSTDTSPAILARHPAVRVIQEPPEYGLEVGYHAGVAHAKYGNLFFCNEDMWFHADCLERLAGHIVPGSGVGAVMPVQRTYDDKGLVNGGLWFLDGWDNACPHPFRTTESTPPLQPAVLSGINAGACLISRQAYEDCGGWDTSFFLDYEDVDLSIRLWQRGWRSVIDPQAIVCHAVGASNDRTIEKGKLRVGRKRFVHGFSNQMAVAIKTFTGPRLFLFPALTWCDRAARDLLKLRWRYFFLDCSAAWLTLQRLPEFRRYRSVNRELNDKFPGQDWFTDPEFDWHRFNGAATSTLHSAEQTKTN